MQNQETYPFSVLIVEDDLPSRIFIKSVTKKFVDNLFEAENGKQGLDQFIKHRPDIVISDIGMPLMNGLDMSRKIKEIQSDTLIILTTAFDNKEMLLDAIDIGIDQYILKPINKQNIDRALHRCFEIKELERKVQSQYDYIQSLSQAVESSMSMVFILQQDGLITYCNPKFTDITGYKYEEIHDKKPCDFLYVEPNINCLEYQDAIAGERPWNGELLCKNSDGEQFWISASLAPIKGESGKAKSFVQVSEDITSRIIAKEELKKSNSILEQRVKARTKELQTTNDKLLVEVQERIKAEEIMRRAKESAEQANNAKSLFLAKVSHELRTPMNGILGMSSILLDTDLTEKQKRSLNIVKYSADQLLKIINDILDYSKMESGKFKLSESEFELRKTICNCLDILRPMAKNKDIELSSEIMPDVPDNLIGDQNRFQQIILNLVGNSVKFTEKGSVQVSCQINEIKENTVDLRFSVKDTGIGISPENLDKLFKSFSQIEHTMTRKHGGTGLGLSISKEIVEQMGGKIHVESQAGVGSDFIFNAVFKIDHDIKLDILTDPDLHDNSLDHVAAKYPDFNAKILVAEDSIINQEVIKEALLMKNCSVDFAENGKEAIEKFQSNDYELIFMDVQMPELDGLAATQKIRQLENGKSIPIIGLTAHVAPEHKQECFDAGMDGYISKPFEWDDVYNILSKKLNNNSNKKPPININKLLKNINNNENLLKKISLYFLNNYEKDLDKFNEAYSESNYEDLARRAHKYKSELGNFGAEEAVKLTKKIEKVSKSEDKSELSDLVSKLNDIINQIAKDLEEILNK